MIFKLSSNIIPKLATFPTFQDFSDFVSLISRGWALRNTNYALASSWNPLGKTYFTEKFLEFDLMFISTIISETHLEEDGEFKILFDDKEEVFSFLLYLKDVSFLTSFHFNWFVLFGYTLKDPSNKMNFWENKLPLFSSVILEIEKNILKFLLENILFFSIFKRWCIYAFWFKHIASGFFNHFKLSFSSSSFIVQWFNMNIKLVPFLFLLYLANLSIYLPLSVLTHMFKIPLYFLVNVQPLFLIVLLSYLFIVYNNLFIKWFILIYQSLFLQNYYQKFLRICSFPLLVLVNFFLFCWFIVHFNFLPLILAIAIFSNLRFLFFYFFFPLVKGFLFPFFSAFLLVFSFLYLFY